MKKSLFLIPVLGVLAASCSSNDPKLNEGGDDFRQNEVKGYLSISLIAPGSLPTRAGEFEGNYEYGQPYENYVSKVRFYFFGEDGNAIQVSKNPANDQYYSYIDWTPATQGTTNGQPGETVTDPDPEPGGNGTIEKELNATFRLTGPVGEAKPSAVVAIINPPYELLPSGNPSLSDLRLTDNNYLNGLTNNNFVMSNSVYADGTPLNALYAQIIEEKNFASSYQEAEANPLTIYIERVVSRLDLGYDEDLKMDNDYLVDIDVELTTHDPVSTDNPTTNYTKKKVYAKLMGWAVTSTPLVSNLIKEINPSWNAGIFGNQLQPWNARDYFRSFWAINPESLSENIVNGYEWFSFNELAGINDTKQTGFQMNVNRAYMQENANPYNNNGEEYGASPVEPTRVIFAAQLVDEDGNEIEVTEYNHQYYTLEGLKNIAATNLNMYYKEGNAYKNITPEMIDFASYTVHYDNATPIGYYGSYESYFTLNTEKTSGITEWYSKSETVTGSEDPYTKINTNIDDYMFDSLGNALIWKGGYTYYYFPIQHLGISEENTGYYGVVRNHIYNANVTLISGLGTPVWDPKEDIYPQKPDNSGDLIAAQIKILMWRLVTKDYEMEWPK